MESLASPEPASGVRLKRCRGSLPGRDVTVSLLIPGHRCVCGGGVGNPLEECVFGNGGGDAATSLSTLAVSGVADESSLEGLYTHHDGDAIADGGEWFVFISPVAFCLLGTSCWPC